MTDWKPLARPCAPVCPSVALRHDDRALAADRVHERLCDRGAHELVVGSKKREDVDLIERRDQRVHVDHRDPGLNHPDDRLR